MIRGCPEDEWEAANADADAKEAARLSFRVLDTACQCLLSSLLCNRELDCTSSMLTISALYTPVRPAKRVSLLVTGRAHPPLQTVCIDAMP